MTMENREILISREFDAQKELVFNAWTSPDKIGQWWGQAGSMQKN